MFTTKKRTFTHLLTGAVLILAASPVFAFSGGYRPPSDSADYVRTMTCGPRSSKKCINGQTPRPIAWPTNCVEFFVNKDGSTDFSNTDKPMLTKAALQAVVRGFYAWNAPDTSQFAFYYGGTTNEKIVRSDAGNQNVNAVIWRDEWPDDVGMAIALTSTSYHPSTGDIVDADIEVNTSPDFKITVPPMEVETDLQNTITHEAGHVLGLNHTRVPDATMYGTARVGETTKRTLKPVDVEGISAIYPAGSGPSCTLNHRPYYRHIDQALSSNDDSSGCSTTPDRPRDATVLVLLVAGLVFGIRRRFS